MTPRRDVRLGSASFKQKAHICDAERTKLVHESDAGVELRKSRCALFNPGHADQNETESPFVEDGAHLFQSTHAEPVGFVDQNECCRISDCSLLPDSCSPGQSLRDPNLR